MAVIRRNTAAAIKLEGWLIKLSHWIKLITPYTAARIIEVVNLRMKSSNLPLVGHMRRRKGTSTKRIMKEHALDVSVLA